MALPLSEAVHIAAETHVHVHLTWDEGTQRGEHIIFYDSKVLYCFTSKLKDFILESLVELDSHQKMSLVVANYI